MRKFQISFVTDGRKHTEIVFDLTEEAAKQYAEKKYASVSHRPGIGEFDFEITSCVEVPKVGGAQ